jgi:hypothetical protein
VLILVASLTSALLQTTAPSAVAPASSPTTNSTTSSTTRSTVPEAITGSAVPTSEDPAPATVMRGATLPSLSSADPTDDPSLSSRHVDDPDKMAARGRAASQTPGRVDARQFRRTGNRAVVRASWRQ